MNNIDRLNAIISELSGQGDFEKVAALYSQSYHIANDSYFRYQLRKVINDGGCFRVNRATSLLERKSGQYLYSTAGDRFSTIQEAMRYVFSKNVAPRKAYFEVDESHSAWFPQFHNSEWDNTWSDDQHYWYEKPKQNISGFLDDRLRYVFAHDNDGYRFAGLFQFIELQEGQTRVYKLADDKVKILGNDASRKLMICNISYMKYYRGITADDVIQGGGGKYPTQNRNGGEIYNFMEQNGMIYGFVETNYTTAAELGNPNYAKQICLESIHYSAIGHDYITGVRVVFISKGPNNDRNIVIGWYDNATVYRRRQSSNEGLGYNITCAPMDAHLIDEQDRVFKYPKKNDDGTYNFGQQNTSYPFISNNVATIKLAKELNEYINNLNSCN